MTFKPLETVYLAAIARFMIFGSAFVAMKIALQSINPMMVVYFRYLIAFLVLNFIIKQKYSYTKVQKKDFKPLILLGLIEPVLFYIFDAYGLKYTTASKATIILSMTPVLVAIIAVPVLKEKLSKVRIVSIVVSVLGVYLIVGKSIQSASAQESLKGDILIILAAITHAAYTVFARKLSFQYSYFTISRFQANMALIGFLPLVVAESVSTDIPTPSLNSILAIIYLGIVVSAVGFLVLNYTIANLSAANSSIFQNVVPIVTMILSALILKESIGLNKILGFLLIAVSVITLSFIERRKKSKRTDIIT